MKSHPLLLSIAIATALAAGSAFAKAPPDATGECKDGSYTKATGKEGACSSHGGVKVWMGAAPPAKADRPANATGECKDGSYSDAASKSGACSGHKGVKEWYAPAEAAPKATPVTADKPIPMPRPSEATGSSSNRPVNAQPTARASPSGMPTTAAAGGGNGKVWVNTGTHVYHCEKDAFYGKTKKGAYMTEAEAKSSGSRAARGKACA